MDLHYIDCPVLEYYPLTPHGVDKLTFHVEIGVPETFIYRVGDSVAIRPHNRSDLVDRMLSRVPDHSEHDIKELQQTWSITRSSGKLLRYLFEKQKARQNLDELELALSNRELAKELLEHHETPDILDRFDATLQPSDFSQTLMPLLPRFYSIASSQKADPSRLALTVAHVNYYHHGARVGVCSDYLLRLSHTIGEPECTLQVALHPTRDFHLGAPERDIVMIGPGTGIAPFRAFMIERLTTKATGRSWLFFGERYRSCLFYESLWQRCTQELPFKITCAFSREQAQKIYVQHRLKEHSRELANWLDHAIFYVCGDAKQMAKDVEQTLLDILSHEKGLNESQARDFLKNMRREGRYLRDIY